VSRVKTTALSKPRLSVLFSHHDDTHGTASDFFFNTLAHLFLSKTENWKWLSAGTHAAISVNPFPGDLRVNMNLVDTRATQCKGLCATRQQTWRSWDANPQYHHHHLQTTGGIYIAATAEPPCLSRCEPGQIKAVLGRRPIALWWDLFSTELHD
jgi:hypothetical protein